MAEIINGIYKITNTITGDFYIGSSKNIKHRWVNHKCPSRWNDNPNSPLYLDMKKYGVDKFVFEVIEEVEPEQLKEKEQQFIETLKPTYNRCRANGWDCERYKKHQKEYNKEYHKTDKYKEYNKKYKKEYQKTDKYKEYQKEYQKEYNNQLCSYNGEVLTLCALAKRFRRAGIPHPTAEAKKFIIKR